MCKTGKFVEIKSGKILPDYTIKLHDSGKYSVDNKDGEIGSEFMSIEEVLNYTFCSPSRYKVVWDLKIQLNKSYIATDGSIIYINQFRDGEFKSTFYPRYSWSDNGYCNNGPNLMKEYELELEGGKSYYDTRGAKHKVDVYDKHSFISYCGYWTKYDSKGKCLNKTGNEFNLVMEAKENQLLTVEIGKSYYDRKGNIHVICGMIGDGFTNKWSNKFWNNNGRCHLIEQTVSDLVMEVPNQKPSLGLSPKFTWKDPRILEIKEAVITKIDNQEKIPEHWISEYNKIIEV